MQKIDPSHSPRLTIGLMTRNYAAFIRQAIESVQSQTVTDWELIISDDGSTDDTYERIKPYLHDPRVSYTRHDPPLGQAGNWASCLKAGRAPIVAVLHADDAYLADTFATALAAFEEDEKLDLFYGNFARLSHERFTADVKPADLAWQDISADLDGFSAFSHLCRNNQCLPSASFIRRKLVDRAGMPDPRLIMLVDTEFYRRAALASRHVTRSSKPLTRYRLHGGGVTHESSNNGTLISDLKQFQSIFNENTLERDLRPSSQEEAFQKSLMEMVHGFAKQLADLAVNEAMNGRLREARLLSRDAWRQNSKLWRKPKCLIDRVLIESAATSFLRCLHRGRLGH